MQKTMKKRMFTALTVMTLAFGIWSSAQAQAPEDDVFGVVTVSNLEALLPKLSQFVDNFQPGMGGMLNTAMIGNMLLHNPNLAGVNVAGDFGVVVLNPMKFPGNPVAILVPVTNKDEYLGAVKQTLTAGAEADGIYTFTQPDQKSVLLAFSGEKGIMAETTEVAALVKSLVDANSAALSEAPVVKGQITASIGMKKLMTAMQPMIDMMKQQMMATMEQGMAAPSANGEKKEGAAQPDPAAVKAIAEAEVNMVLSILNQTEKVQLGIGVEENGLRLAKAVFAGADTNFAKFIAAQSPKKSALLGAIPSDSAILMSGSINFTPEFIAGYMDFMKVMASVGQKDPAAGEKVVAWTQAFLEALGSDFAAGILSPSSNSLVTEVFTVKDAAKAKELVQQYPDMIASMTGMYKEMGMDVKMTLADTAQVKSGEILNFNFNLDASKIPDPQGQEVFKTLFGDSLQIPIGLVGDYIVIGVGKDSATPVAGLMDTLKSGAETAAKYTPAMFGMPDDSNFFMYVSIPKFMDWASKNIPDTPKIEFPADTPGIAMGMRFVDGHIENELFLPTAELLAIAKIGQQAQMKQGAAPAEETPAEAPADDDSSDDESADDEASDDESADEDSEE